LSKLAAIEKINNGISLCKKIEVSTDEVSADKDEKVQR
jgi:hypothetical protein